MMLQEIINRQGKALMLLSLLLGIGFLALLSLPHIHNAEEPAITMAAMASAPSRMTQSMQPSRAWQPLRNNYGSRPSWTGRFMQPMKTQQPVQSVAALTSPDKSDQSMYPATHAESRFDPSSVSAMQGRREMIAAAFAMAAAAAFNFPAVAGDQVPDKIYSTKPMKDVPENLPKAEDFTRYDTVQSKGAASTNDKKPGSVAAPGWALPAAGVGVLAFTAAIPALLSPGETAFNAQLSNEKGQRRELEKNRQQIRTQGKRFGMNIKKNPPKKR